MTERNLSPLTILIADDSNSDRLLLDAIIRRQGHRTVIARDGREAITLFQQVSPDIILLDALMPDVDGFEAARFIKANSQGNFYPIIFLTSLNETHSLAGCLDAGGDDFLTKPYNSVILKAKINAFTRMLKMHQTVQRQRDQIVENNMRLIREQEVAKLTFDKIAHEGCLNAPNIRHILSPLAIFNGDVLLAALRPNGNLCVLLGDFTGHGLSAAMGAIPLSQAFYSMVAKGFQIRAVASELNAKLKEILPVSIFCCASIVDVDFSRKTVEVWNGGLPNSYVFRSRTLTVDAFPSLHLPLGILDSETFNDETTIIPLDDDDRFILCSDGVCEAENGDREQFGESRLLQVFEQAESADAVFDGIKSAIDDFTGGNPLADDLSLVEICMVSRETFENYNIQKTPPSKSVDADWSFKLTLNPESLRASDPLPLIQQLFLDSPWVRPFAGDLFIIISELFNNALDHGLLGLDSSLKSSPDGFNQYYAERDRLMAELSEGQIEIALQYQGSNEKGRLEIFVTDSGVGFDYRQIKSLQQQQKLYSGRGLYLVESLCAEVIYLDPGNKVKALFSWGGG